MVEAAKSGPDWGRELDAALGPNARKAVNASERVEPAVVRSRLRELGYTDAQIDVVVTS